jgi:hypothetical protein
VISLRPFGQCFLEKEEMHMKKFCMELVVFLVVMPCSADITQKIKGVGDRARVFSGTVQDVFSSDKRRAISLDEARALLSLIDKELQDLSEAVFTMFQGKILNQVGLSLTLLQLTRDAKNLSRLETLSENLRKDDQLKQLSDSIKSKYAIVQAEVGALEVLLQGYDAYQRDLAENFQRLPNKVLPKPDVKKLYEELGLSAETGIAASFDSVLKNYEQRFASLQKIGGDDFDSLYFRPYLRVLQYVFRTALSKQVYDLFLRGELVYAAKSELVKKYEKTIKKLFNQDVPSLSVIPGTISSVIN